MTRPALAFLALALVGCGGSPSGTPVKLPDGAPGIGFDDLRYSASLHRVLVPGGRSGRLDLVDPESLAVTSIGGFSTKRDYSGGHDDGPTSVEEALGKLYVTDRTAVTLVVADPSSRTIVSSTPLASGAAERAGKHSLRHGGRCGSRLGLRSGRGQALARR